MKQPPPKKRLHRRPGLDKAEKSTQHTRERKERKVGIVNGVLDILRKGVTNRGAKFKLAYFKPSGGMNPEF